MERLGGVDFRPRPGWGTIATAFNFGHQPTVFYKTPAFEQVPPEYRIRIKSTEGHVDPMGGAGGQAMEVWGVLHESLSLRTTSEWVPFVPQRLQATALAIAQAFGRSAVTRLGSRRMWTGTQPISMQLHLLYNAFESAWDDVVVPCQKLMQLVMPSVAGEGAHLKQFLIPPGPLPFAGTAEAVRNWLSSDAAKEFQDSLVGEGAVGKGIEKLKDRFMNWASAWEHLDKLEGERISVQIGNFIAFPSVIVKEVNPVFDARMDEFGCPVSAKVDITFETYEMLTKGELANAFVLGSTTASRIEGVSPMRRGEAGERSRQG